MLIIQQTSEAVYILATTTKDGMRTNTLERKIPLVTIKSIGMSNLRDDWIVRVNLRISCVV